MIALRNALLLIALVAPSAMSQGTVDPTLFECNTMGVPMCMNTGLALGFLDCDDDTDVVDPCFADPETCGLSCGTCPICLEPSPVPGFDIVLQYTVLPGRFLPINILNAVEFSGFQATVVCTDAVSGAPTTVDALAAINYGAASTPPNSFLGSTGIEGKFLSFDLGGGVIPAGFDLFLVLTLDEEDLLACAPDSVALSGVVVPNQQGVELSVCGSIEQPCPAPPAEVSVISDPHFSGFRGQTFDITGQVGSIYTLISDSGLALNARFAAAYTTGLLIDQESGAVSQMHPHGTWMSEIGIVIDGTTIQISAGPSSIQSEECLAKPQDCLKYGSVVVNGDAAAGVQFVGRMAAAKGVTLQITNKHAFSTVVIESMNMNMQVDIVPPPKSWAVSDSEYYHLNLHLNHVNLSPNASGILGDSTRVKYDSEGEPIMVGLDDQGAGILDKAIEEYVVESMLAH